MYYFLTFKQNDKKYFLYDGDSFVAGSTDEKAHHLAALNTGISLSVRGFDIVPLDVEQLGKAVGGVPFKVMHFSGGMGKPFEGVEWQEDKK